MGQAPLRLLIVDDHEVVRLGLRLLLERQPEYQVVGEAATAAEAVAQADRTAPDLVLMDVRLPDGSGVEACREIRAARPQTRVLILTSYADEDAVVASVMAGAAGYLLKETRAADLVAAIREAAAGRSLLDPRITGTLLEKFRALFTGDAERPGDLTAQERRVLALVAEGCTNREIAAEMNLSEKTVKNYVSTLLSKLNLRRRAEAAAYAVRMGLGRS